MMQLDFRQNSYPRAANVLSREGLWLIYGSNVHDSMYGLLGSLVPVIPTKELIETTLMARKSRSVHALIFSLHKHAQRYYL
jgi:hypothetical protein